MKQPAPGEWWGVFWSDPGWPALVLSALAIVAAVWIGVAQIKLGRDTLRRSDTNTIIVKSRNPSRAPWRVERATRSRWTLINDSVDDVTVNVYVVDPAAPRQRLAEWELIDAGESRLFTAESATGEPLERVVVFYSRPGMSGDDEWTADLTG